VRAEVAFGRFRMGSMDDVWVGKQINKQTIYRLSTYTVVVMIQREILLATGVLPREPRGERGAS